MSVEGVGAAAGGEEILTGGAEWWWSSSTNAKATELEDVKPSVRCDSFSLSLKLFVLRGPFFAVRLPPFSFRSDMSVSMFLEEPNLKNVFFLFFSLSASVSTEKDVEEGMEGLPPFSFSLSFSFSFLSTESGDFSKCAEKEKIREERRREEK